MTIQQGDQYAIPIKIKMENDIVTPQNCNDVRVKINDVLKSYTEGQITYNSTDQTWLYPLTEEMSRSFERNVSAQIGVKISDDFIYSPVQHITVELSIIKEKWDD